MDLTSGIGKMFGKLAPGMCRLSMDGKIAVKTSNGYKAYNTKTERLVNCSNFVFDVGEEFFFLIPTNKVKKGDIILVTGKPRCVVSADDKKITVINYEDSTVETVLPERHVFLGNTYFYGKIVSLFGNGLSASKGNGMGNIMKYMMLSEMMKGNGTSGANNMSNLMPLMLMTGGGFGDMFNDMFDADDIFGIDTEDEEEKEN